MLIKKNHNTVLLSYFILAIVLIAYLLSSLTIRSDMSFFTSNNTNNDSKIIQQYLLDGDANRLLFIVLDSPKVSSKKSQDNEQTIKKLIHFSHQLKQEIIKNDQFTLIENTQQSIEQIMAEPLYQYRYIINSESDNKKHFSIASLKQQFNKLQQRLQMVTSIDEQAIIAQSPLNVWFRYLQSINKTQLKQQHGVWFTEQAQAVLLLKTKASGFDLKQQAKNRQFLEQRITAILSDGVNYSLSGAAIIALENSKKIAFQIQIISTLASVILILFLFLVFRSIKQVLLISLPLFFAVLAGTSIVNWIYGYVHGISLAFGITIIGIAVDYPIHYFSHLIGLQKTELQNKSHYVNNKTSLLAIWPKLLLGLITTLIGFSAITFSDFSGLNQLGIFAMTGLIVAMLITRYLLPLFHYNSIKLTHSKVILYSTQVLLFKNRCYFRSISLALILLSIVYITTHNNLWENDLANLSPISDELKNNDFKLRKSLNLPELRYVLLVSAHNEQVVLRKIESLSPFLEQLIHSKAITYYDSAARYIPSIDTQKQRQHALPTQTQLYKNLHQALKDTPFDIQAFAPFIKAVTTNKNSPPLTPNDLHQSLFATKINSLLFLDKSSNNQETNKQKYPNWIGMIILSGVDGSQLSTEFKQYKKTSKANKKDTAKIQLIDIKEQTNKLVKNYRIDALYWFLWGSFFIILSLVIYIKKITQLPALLLPFSGAIILSVSLLLLLGYSLSIFHLVTLLLVVGLGIDYSIFISQIDANNQVDNQQKTINLFSVLICAISSIIMFFSLSLSSIPVLKAIGLTASLGTALAFILSLIFSRPCKASE